MGKLRKTWEEDQSSRWVGATTRRRRSMTLRYMICSEEGQRPCCSGMTWGHPYDIYIFDSRSYSIWFGVCNDTLARPNINIRFRADTKRRWLRDLSERTQMRSDCCWGSWLCKWLRDLSRRCGGAHMADFTSFCVAHLVKCCFLSVSKWYIRKTGKRGRRYVKKKKN